MFTPEICKDWNEVHRYECECNLDCPINKTLHSILELCNHLELAFVPPIVEQDIPLRLLTKGERKNIIQVLEQSKDNDVFSIEPSSKKLKVFKFAPPSDINPAFSTILKPFTSLRIKIKATQTTQCSLDKVSFELILNDYF